jgi:hypothetical protein
MDLKSIADPKSGDVSPYTPFTKFCLNALPPLNNFSVCAEEEAKVLIKEEEKKPSRHSLLAAVQEQNA